MTKGGAVYIMSCPDKTTLYVGVTSDLFNRVIQHKEKFYPASFTAKYNCSLLVYYKWFEGIEEAIAEEKRIKSGSRKKKIQLIEALNEGWKDLFDSIDPLY